MFRPASGVVSDADSDIGSVLTSSLISAPFLLIRKPIRSAALQSGCPGGIHAASICQWALCPTYQSRSRRVSSYPYRRSIEYRLSCSNEKYAREISGWSGFPDLAVGGFQKIDSLYRLLLIPGTAHCGGGDGTSTFDMIPMIDAWAGGQDLR